MATQQPAFKFAVRGEGGEEVLEAELQTKE